MRIDELILDCVCFLCTRKAGDFGDEYEPRATGFFVVVGEYTVGDPSRVYLVTAKHNVVQAQAFGGLHIRLNERDGGGVVHLPVQHEWFTAIDADVAVCPFAPSSRIDQRVRHGLLPERIFATDDAVKENRIGIGDDVIIAGLFAKHHGTRRAHPIVRSGIIASMPNEPIRTRNGEEYSGYLIEVRSIGGLSGSPVLVMLESHRKPNGKVDHVHRSSFLLGLIRGHWDYRGQGDLNGKGAEEAGEVNMGMAIVTPMKDVVGLLHREDVVREREEAFARERERGKRNLNTAYPPAG